MEKLIECSIRAGLDPLYFEIVDESSLHAGHAGAQPGGETHYRIVVVSDGFAGLSRVARQQAVYALLNERFENGLHALTMQTLTPEEFDLKQGAVAHCDRKISPN